jgi:hypothetical protein
MNTDDTTDTSELDTTIEQARSGCEGWHPLAAELIEILDNMDRAARRAITIATALGVVYTERHNVRGALRMAPLMGGLIATNGSLEAILDALDRADEVEDEHDMSAMDMGEMHMGACDG